MIVKLSRVGNTRGILHEDQAVCPQKEGYFISETCVFNPMIAMWKPLARVQIKPVLLAGEVCLSRRVALVENRRAHKTLPEEELAIDLLIVPTVIVIGELHEKSLKHRSESFAIHEYVVIVLEDRIAQFEVVVGRLEHFFTQGIRLLTD